MTENTKQLPFTCITCHVAFPQADLQRDHFKLDWHRYNLKRRIAELPPISAEEFQRKVLLNQQSIANLANQNTTVYCEICTKNFANQNSFENHLKSKKHKERERNSTAKSSSIEADLSDTKVEEEDVDSDEWDDTTENPIDGNNCLFCLHHSRNFIKNLEHMTTDHSFFIPDIEYCTDVFELVHYLGEKIEEGFMCLWCSETGKGFRSAAAARNHMLDKGHCRILLEGLSLAEYADFYDYSTSYPDNSDDISKDEEVSIPELEKSDYQLVLPSGSTIGHRSLMCYYKQRINPNSNAQPISRTKKLNKILTCYRNLGWVATKSEDVSRKARDLQYMKKVHDKQYLAMGVKGNKLQKHFRPQVNF